jgi:pimeloyl-ACP methyl ester carboxylesterase
MVERPDIDEFAVDVNGGKLAVFGIGAASQAAPVVIAVHGITANSRAWLPTARALDGRATVIAPDIRGRGESNELPGPYGLASHAADLLAILDQLELERVVLVGHSLGAYIVSHFGVEHPQRVEALVLVDGGLTIPGSEGADPQEFVDAFLGPAIARLTLRFPTREAYLHWWRQHPAIAGSDIAEQDLVAYVEHDTVGEEPELRSSVAEPAVRGDAGELAAFGVAARRLSVPARLLCAPRGLLDDPRPMQPIERARAWARDAPGQRHATLVEDVNHYTITLGARGAAAVADAIAASIPAGLSGRH